MKTFLSAWLAEAPKVLEREFSGELILRPSARLPEPETAVSLAVAVNGSAAGRFLVSADRAALHALLVAARVVAADSDADTDRELWRGVLQQSAAAAAQSLDAPGATVAVEDAAWKLGLPAAAYELRLGESSMLIAFVDEVRMPEAAASGAGKAASNPVTSARVAPGGVDLLLDVELETSLRFGSREMPLNEVLDLGAGDVVELDLHVSDPVDLLVGDKIVARGEVVLVNGSFGLRVLEVAEPKKCLESIRCLF